MHGAVGGGPLDARLLHDRQRVHLRAEPDRRAVRGADPEDRTAGLDGRGVAPEGLQHHPGGVVLVPAHPRVCVEPPPQRLRVRDMGREKLEERGGAL
jgi:hypothetical protein